jgi:hypothetical protein
MHFFLLKFLLKLDQVQSHIKCGPIPEVLPTQKSDKTSVRSKSESYCNISHKTSIVFII